MVDIIVKDKDKDKERLRRMGVAAFMSSVSKGSARPAFCNPGGVERMKETVGDMRRNLDLGNVAPHQRKQYEVNLRKHEERLSAITDETNMAKEVYNADQEYYDKRVAELEKEIRRESHSKKDVNEKRINPHTILRAEQEGLKEKKLEYQTLKRLRGESPDLTYVQK